MRRLLLKLTHRLWNAEISRILGRAQQAGVINNVQYHAIASRFDPTQRHLVGNDRPWYDPAREPVSVVEMRDWGA